MIDEIIDLMQVRSKDCVLHLGIGDGAVARRLARLADEGLALGVDPSDDAVRLARRLSVDVENLMFVLGSHEEIPWQEGFFSVVLSTAPAANWAKAAQEVFRVLAPGGRVFVLAPPDRGAELFQEAHFRSLGFHHVPAVVLEATKPR